MKKLWRNIKFWVVSKAWSWFGWNWTGRPIMIMAEFQMGCIPVERRKLIVPILFKRDPDTQRLLDELNSRPSNVNNESIRKLIAPDDRPYTRDELINCAPNPAWRSPEHGEQTGAYCDLNGTYQIFWDGIRKREVFICTCCKRIYDTVPQGGCECES